MTPETSPRQYTRDEVVEILKEFSSLCDGHPDNLDSNDPRIAQSESAVLAWIEQEQVIANKTGTLEAELSMNLTVSTIYIDAGYHNQDYLDEIANDWLVQDEETAIGAGLTKLAETIREKREKINTLAFS